MLTTRQQERLQTRVLAVIQSKRHQEFTAAEVAQVLAADKFDVLHVLHGLKADRKVEHIAQLATFQDRWRLTPYAVYQYSPIHTQSVAEAL